MRHGCEGVRHGCEGVRHGCEGVRHGCEGANGVRVRRERDMGERAQDVSRSLTSLVHNESPGEILTT